MINVHILKTINWFGSYLGFLFLGFLVLLFLFNELFNDYCSSSTFCGSKILEIYLLFASVVYEIMVAVLAVHGLNICLKLARRLCVLSTPRRISWKRAPLLCSDNKQKTFIMSVAAPITAETKVGYFLVQELLVHFYRWLVRFQTTSVLFFPESTVLFS